MIRHFSSNFYLSTGLPKSAVALKNVSKSVDLGSIYITITMTSDEKIKWVRDYIYEQEKLAGLGVVSYSLAPEKGKKGTGTFNSCFLST